MFEKTITSLKLLFFFSDLAELCRFTYCYFIEICFKNIFSYLCKSQCLIIQKKFKGFVTLLKNQI